MIKIVGTEPRAHLPGGPHRATINAQTADMQVPPGWESFSEPFLWEDLAAYRLMDSAELAVYAAQTRLAAMQAQQAAEKAADDARVAEAARFALRVEEAKEAQR